MKYNYKQIGEVLKNRRTELGKDLSGLAEETKIIERYLAAIEVGDPKEFPSLVYYELFAHSYAREMGLDADEIFDAAAEPEPLPLQKATEVPSPLPEIKAADKKPEIKSKGKSPLRAILSFAAIIFIAIIIILIIILKGKTPQENEPAQNESTQISTSNEYPLDSIQPSIMPSDSTTHDSLAPVPVVAGGKMKLSVYVKQTCWFLIIADKDTAVDGSLPPGTNREITALDKFVVAAGNPAGVEFKLNDTLLKPLSPGGRPLRGLEINQSNKREFYSIPKDSGDGGH